MAKLRNDADFTICGRVDGVSYSVPAGVEIEVSDSHAQKVLETIHADGGGLLTLVPTPKPVPGPVKVEDKKEK